MIVVDNSVITGLVLPSDAYHHEAMAARLRDAEWHAPQLCRTEFRSVAAGHLRKGEPVATLIAAAHDAAAAVQTHTLTDAEVFAVLSTSPLSAYDSEYVALAHRIGCRLVTTERDVLQHFPETAVRLSDYAAGG